MKVKQIVKISLVLVWMIIIFIFSNEPATKSTKLSDSFIKRTISRLINDDSVDTIKKLTKPVRKCAHFTIYLILGLLVLNCFNLLDKKTIIIAIFICFSYSISDEIHQLFVKGRSCEILDVVIDTLGSTLGIFINKIIRRNKFEK